MGGQSVRMVERAGAWVSEETRVYRDEVYGQEQVENPVLVTPFREFQRTGITINQ